MSPYNRKLSSYPMCIDYISKYSQIFKTAIDHSNSFHSSNSPLFAQCHCFIFAMEYYVMQQFGLGIRSWVVVFLYKKISIRLLSVLHGHSFFSSPPQQPMTPDIEGFLYQILSITLFSYLNS